MHLQVSGREVFEFHPELVDDDDAEASDTRYASEDGEDDEEEVILKLSTLYKCFTECVRLCSLPPEQMKTSYGQWLFNLALYDFIFICALWSSTLEVRCPGTITTLI